VIESSRVPDMRDAVVFSFSPFFLDGSVAAAVAAAPLVPDGRRIYGRR